MPHTASIPSSTRSAGRSRSAGGEPPTCGPSSPPAPEQQLGSGVIQRGEPDFVDQEQVVAEQGLDHFPDAVVGQAAVEGIGQVGGGEVADLVPGLDGGDAEGDQDVALARAGRYPQVELLGSMFSEVRSLLRSM